MDEVDRDLLERAAKAVGITLDFRIRGDFPPYYVNERGGHSSWNPLTDDGDALRLAVKLNMAVSVHERHCMACAQTGTMQTVEGMPTDQATRRAIVRAAAALGDAK